MSIREACATFGFAAPPHDRRELKTKFLELAKKYHPDRPHGSAVKMTQLNAAYAVLKRLQEHGIRSASAGSTRTAGNVTDPGVTGAPDFAVPGVNVSTTEMWLPWQKKATARSESRGPLECGSLYRFVKHSRYMDRREQEVLAKAMEQQKKSSVGGGGSNNFTTEHVLLERAKRQQQYGRSVGLFALSRQYLVAKCKVWPQTLVANLKYIITGRI